MKKTSVYLTETEAASLERMAREQGISQSEVLRAAIAMYERQKPVRVFAMEGTFEGDGTSIADVPGEELLRGFGE